MIKLSGLHFFYGGSQMAKANVYEMVTERIIAELEKGIIPWEKPWTGVRDGAFKRGFDSRHQLYFFTFLYKTGY